MIGWDNPATARYYEAFDRDHGRYREANAELAARAALEEGLRVLDVGAGLGGTARATLLWLGATGRIVCFEPAAAMRARGQGLLDDPRVTWAAHIPDGETFDRVLCGASIWLLGHLRDAVSRLAELVADGGALCFTIPSLYLGEPDEPGGGSDPLLLSLAGLLADGRTPVAEAIRPLPTHAEVDALLSGLELQPYAWTLRVPISQAMLRDWLKIPPLTDSLLGELSAEERASAVDDAYARTDARSWRWEAWSGWTAWKSVQNGVADPTLSGT